MFFSKVFDKAIIFFFNIVMLALLEILKALLSKIFPGITNHWILGERNNLISYLAKTTFFIRLTHIFVFCCVYRMWVIS